jgi:hypothetical protein
MAKRDYCMCVGSWLTGWRTAEKNSKLLHTSELKKESVASATYNKPPISKIHYTANATAQCP